MTLAELHEHVYAGLPAQYRFVASRRIVSRIVTRAVSNWPTVTLEQCDDGETQVVGQHMAKSLHRQSRNEYGMGIILTLVLGALVQEIVKLLIQWWLDSRENKDAMRLLTREARHHD